MNSFSFVPLNEIFKHFYGGGHRMYGWCRECNAAIMSALKARLKDKYKR